MPASNNFPCHIHARRRRCDARIKNHFKLMPNGSIRTRSPFCQSWAMKGKTRCRMHGGASTGPRRPEGKARVVAAMVKGRRRWVERMKAEGRRFPGGRKAGEAWLTPAMKERRQAEGLRREAQRWASMTSAQRLAEQQAAERAAMKRAIATMIDNLERTGTLRG
jgi:hypothetical protein